MREKKPDPVWLRWLALASLVFMICGAMLFLGLGLELGMLLIKVGAGGGVILFGYLTLTRLVARKTQTQDTSHNKASDASDANAPKPQR